MNDHLARLAATTVAALICGYWMHLNGGKSGIGWFILAIAFIW